MPPDETLPSGILPYDPDKFVDRESEIALVLDKARRLGVGSQVAKRTVVFWGYKGTGRTWLLQHLERELPKRMPGVVAAYVNLLEWCNQDAASALLPVLQHLDGKLAAAGGAPRSTSASLAGPLDAVRGLLWARIERLLLEKVLVILLDHVYEADHELLHALEDEVLTSLSACPQVLLVMAGRGQSYYWRAPEVRLNAEILPLVPFDLDVSREQLEKQKPEALDRLAEIFGMSQGYPLGNWLLAARSSVADALSEAVNELLGGVPQTEREYLEAVCIVRSFNEDSLPVLLSARKEDPSIGDWSYRDIREARDSLIATGLVRWQEDASGWVIDAAVGPLVQQCLHSMDCACWTELQCTAYRLFARWAEQYPQERQRWGAEAAYHAECLLRAGLSVDQCP